MIKLDDITKQLRNNLRCNIKIKERDGILSLEFEAGVSYCAIISDHEDDDEDDDLSDWDDQMLWARFPQEMEEERREALQSLNQDIRSHKFFAFLGLEYEESDTTDATVIVWYRVTDRSQIDSNDA